MSKKSRRAKARSKKWSRANILAFAATALIALSMVLGSALSFSAPPAQVQSTAVPTAIITIAPVLANATLTPVSVTPTP